MTFALEGKENFPDILSKHSYDFIGHRQILVATVRCRTAIFSPVKFWHIYADRQTIFCLTFLSLVRFESDPSSSESEGESDAEDKPKPKEKKKKKESPEKKRKAGSSKSASPKKKAKITVGISKNSLRDFVEIAEKFP